MSDAVSAFVDQLAVPNNDPVIPFVIESEPLIDVKDPDWYIELVPTELAPVNTGM